jgi:tetratricopeptide (TPR) repeat protein
VHAAMHAGDKERALQGHHYRALCLLEAGDMPSVYGELDAKAKLVEELRQPAQRWYLASVQATLATFEGRFDEAVKLIEQAFLLGERAEGSMASVYRVIHLHALRGAQGRLAEHHNPAQQAAAEFQTYVVLRCVLTHISAELGNQHEARAILDSLAADNLAALPQNEEWLFGMCLLADVAAALGDAPRAAEIYSSLLPYAALNAVSAPDSCLGSVSRNLGVLAATLARWGRRRKALRGCARDEHEDRGTALGRADPLRPRTDATCMRRAKRPPARHGPRCGVPRASARARHERIIEEGVGSAAASGLSSGTAWHRVITRCVIEAFTRLGAASEPCGC